MSDGQITVRLFATPDLGPGAAFNIYLGAIGGGAINYSADPVNNRPIPAFPDGVGLMGYGTAPYGGANFGFDFPAGSGPGYGGGPYGAGPYGLDCFEQDYAISSLADGNYRVGVVAVDGLGNASAARESTVAVAGTPDPADSLTVTGVVAGAASVAWAF